MISDENFKAVVLKSLVGIDHKLTGIDVRLDGIDLRLDSVDGRLDRLETKIDKHYQQFIDFKENTEQEFDNLRGYIDQSFARIADLLKFDDRITKLEIEVLGLKTNALI